MGPRLAADFLEMAGFDVRFLGANVPASHLVHMLQSDPPDVLALSITLPIHLPALRATVQAIRDAKLDVPIVVGGHALEWDPTLANGLDAQSGGTDADALIAAVRTLVEAA